MASIQFIKISATHWGACANRLTNNNKMQMPTLLFLARIKRERKRDG